MTQKEENKNLLLLLQSLIKDKRYDDVILLGNTLFNSTPAMKKSFKIMTEQLTHPDIIEISNKL